MSKRNLFQELMNGIGDMADQREGKIPLRQYEVEAKPAPATTAIVLYKVFGLITTDFQLFKYLGFPSTC